MFLMHEKCRYLNGDFRDCRRSNLVTILSQRGQKKVKINGYIEFYLPEHHRAAKGSGCVYEHVLVAEDMLGRELLPEEVVHHKDENRSNNDSTNLMVFATKNDHAAYHAGAEAELQENGSYKCQKAKVVYKYKNLLSTQNSNMEGVEIIEVKDKDICPECFKRLKSKSSKRCLKCDKELRRKNFPSKEELEECLGKMTFVEIGKKYGVTDNSARKWCRHYGLPYRRADIENYIKDIAE